MNYMQLLHLRGDVYSQPATNVKKTLFSPRLVWCGTNFKLAILGLINTAN